MTRRMPLPHNVGQMESPVRCRHCGKVYDLGNVEIVERHADWSVWCCPRCGARVDDRGERGSEYKDYDRIERVTGGLDTYGLPLIPRSDDIHRRTQLEEGGDA